MELHPLINYIKDNGYRITPQRKAIIEVLSSSNDHMMSVELIFNKSKEICSKTNMSTVYRNLQILEKLNLIHKVITKDGLSLYQVISTNTHHHHIICKSCGKTELINFCPIKYLTELSKEKNFILTDHKLELYGYCKDCLEKYNKLSIKN